MDELRKQIEALEDALKAAAECSQEQSNEIRELKERSQKMHTDIERIAGEISQSKARAVVHGSSMR